MNSVVRRKFELIRDRVDLFDDGEGANISGTELFAGQCIRMSRIDSQTF